ncbi:MAG: FtsW/RodA/SpoVE family cell cycle protein, partial [Albidovulum sp.]
MSYLEYNLKTVPTGLRKIFYVNWPLVLLLAAVAAVGFLMLYSVAGGRIEVWAEPQMKRFTVGMTAMLLIGFVPIWFWRNMSALAYLATLLLLVAVEFFGSVGMGAQRWIELGPLRLQPSELMKVALVMLLAAYYDWLDIKKVSHPLWVLVPLVMILVPTFLVLKQPDLGTAILLVAGGGLVMFVAGVSFWYFGTVIALVVALIFGVFESRGKDWQLIEDYQFRRIDTFLDPGSDPLGAGYNITQAQIALGSGGWTGKGFMQGSQSRLNFLPEKHTDFIFTTLAEEFGFVGAFS